MASYAKWQDGRGSGAGTGMTGCYPNQKFKPKGYYKPNSLPKVPESIGAVTTVAVKQDEKSMVMKKGNKSGVGLDVKNPKKMVGEIPAQSHQALPPDAGTNPSNVKSTNGKKKKKDKAPTPPKEQQCQLPPQSLQHTRFKTEEVGDTNGRDFPYQEMGRENSYSYNHPWFKQYGLNYDFRYIDFRYIDLTRYRVGNTVVHADGYIMFRLHGDVRIDMTATRSFRVNNARGNTIMSLSSSGDSMAIIHPFGRLYKHGYTVELDTAYSHEEQKCVKVTPNKITFTSERRSAVFMTNPTGFNKTTDKFSDMSHDISVPVYLDDAFCGPNAVDECLAIIHDQQFFRSMIGDEMWLINGMQIISKVDDGVIVVRRDGRFEFRTSFVTGKSSIAVGQNFKIVATTGSNGTFWVKLGEREFENKEKEFFIRTPGVTTGFNLQNDIQVFENTPFQPEPRFT